MLFSRFTRGGKRDFDDLSEQEVLALAISSEEEDGRIYQAYADGLREDFPASASVFDTMAEEENDHRRRLLDLHIKRFGDRVPLIRREHVRGYYTRKADWLVRPLGVDVVRQQAVAMEDQAYNFYVQAAERTSDAATRKLLGDLAAAEKSHASLASKLTDAIAQFAISRYNVLFWGLLVFAIILVSFMFKNELNDDTVKYFHEDVPFRQAADYTQQNLTGFDIISYSLNSGESNGVNDPAYLAKVEAFSQWYLSQPEVVHVSSFTDVIKRLNKNMHNDDPEWYRLPDSRELAAQYILLYEMSLPFGLDLTNQIDSDKSSLLLRVRVKDQKAQQLIDLDLRAQQWLMANAPEMVTPGASVSIMFAHIGQRNIDSMLTGSLVALVLVTLTLLIALRSFKYGLLSLLPNAFPAGMAFGIWGIFDGEVNLAVAVIFAITLGIVVDDTVHFITKYIRGRKLHGYDAKNSIEYAFTVVGKAIITTTVVLAAGFFVLAFSSFDVNASMGLMVGITIIIALIWDFLFLPSLLIKVDNIEDTRQPVNAMKEMTT